MGNETLTLGSVVKLQTFDTRGRRCFNSFVMSFYSVPVRDHPAGSRKGLHAFAQHCMSLRKFVRVCASLCESV